MPRLHTLTSPRKCSYRRAVKGVTHAPCGMMESPNMATTRGAGRASSCSTITSESVVVALEMSQGSTLLERSVQRRALGSAGASQWSPLTERLAKMPTKLPEVTFSPPG